MFSSNQNSDSLFIFRLPRDLFHLSFKPSISAIHKLNVQGFDDPNLSATASKRVMEKTHGCCHGRIKRAEIDFSLVVLDLPGADKLCFAKEL